MLNGQWALTTKFCADQNLDNELNLGSGFSLKDIQKSGRIPIVQVIEYMKSSDANKTHDIVLLQLHRPMNVETNELKPPCIASKAIPKSGLVVLYGWGSKYPSEIQTEKIGHSSLHYWMHYHNSDKQKKMIASIVSPPANVSNEPENLFWIQAKDSEQVPCQGDFGGPVHQIENGTKSMLSI